MKYETSAAQDNAETGTIQVSGKLELVEPLYVEDDGNRIFRENVAEALSRNGFSDREINHDIYNRVVQASTRIPGNENEYYTFLKVEHEPGFTINFSANLTYKSGTDGYILDGPVRHPQLLGSRVDKFSNPALDNAGIVQKAVENVLAEQARYRELMKQNRALLTQLWDNDFGMVIWNRKTPYLGNENLSIDEQIQLSEFRYWRSVYHITNVKPVQYRTPHASNFFELGSYTTEGIATCLRQTGFIEQLTFLKSKFSQYCEFGKQYPVRIQLSSTLNNTNVFVAKVSFEVNGVSSEELAHDSVQFSRERNEFARYSDQQRLSILKQEFDINHHNRPIFAAIDVDRGEQEHIHLKYTGPSDYVLAGLFDESEIGVTVDAEGQLLATQTISGNGSENISTTPVYSGSSINGVNQIAPNDLSEEEARAKAETELVKAIQGELKRLGVYDSRIDGIAGGYTYWGMRHLKQELGRNDVKEISVEFLSLLRATTEGSIELPTEPYSPPPVAAAPIETPEPEFEEIKIEVEEQPKSKGTLAGSALRWLGKQLNTKKKEEPKKDN